MERLGELPPVELPNLQLWDYEPPTAELPSLYTWGALREKETKSKQSLKGNMACVVSFPSFTDNIMAAWLRVAVTGIPASSLQNDVRA